MNTPAQHHIPPASSPAPSGKKKTKQLVLTLLYASLIISALIGVGFIMFGTDDTYSGKAFSTIGLIFLVDIFLVIAVMSKIAFLKYTSWGVTLAAFVFACLSVWTAPPEPQYYDTYGAPAPERSLTASEVFGDIATGLWVLAVSMVLLAAFSILYKLIVNINTVTKSLYWTLVGVAIAGTLPLSIALAVNKKVWDDFTIEGKVYLSAGIISVTLVAVLLIALVNHIINKNKTTPPNAIYLNPMNNPQMPPAQYQGQQGYQQGHPAPQQPAPYPVNEQWANPSATPPNAYYTYQENQNPNENSSQQWGGDNTQNPSQQNIPHGQWGQQPQPTQYPQNTQYPQQDSWNGSNPTPQHNDKKGE